MAGGGIGFISDFPRDAAVLTDREKLKRILEEVGRNAHFSRDFANRKPDSKSRACAGAALQHH